MFTMTTVERRNVSLTDRLRVTERLIQSQSADHVLEIGAGDFSFDYAKKPGASWVKADFAEPCDMICDFNLEKLVLPFQDDQYDLVICTEVLEHLLWPQRLLKECYRILSPEGKIVISVPNIVSLSYRIAWMIGHIPSCAASGNLPALLGGTAYVNNNQELRGGHVADYNISRLFGLLKLQNFKIINVKGSGIIWHKQVLPHWIVPVSLASNIICVAQKGRCFTDT